ncbi:MAG: hypothetical protein ACRDOJ_12265 [Nocardioidaceae bacterium]
MTAHDGGQFHFCGMHAEMLGRAVATIVYEYRDAPKTVGARVLSQHDHLVGFVEVESAKMRAEKGIPICACHRGGEARP